MSVTTKAGDRGRTSLYFGGSVSKDDLRVDFFGDLDELCSFLGASKSLVRQAKIKKLLEGFQRALFIIGSEAATTKNYLKKLKQRLGESHVNQLERQIDEIEKRNVFDECCFYLPGENLVSAMLDVSRTVCRRAERKAVTLKKKGKLTNPQILIFLNRLSDLLYLLARSSEKKHRKVTP